MSAGNPIPQSYGDRAASTPNVVVDYGSSGNGVVTYWNSGYSDLVDVAWGTANPSRSTITLTPDAGFGVRFLSFNIGFWGSGNQNTGINVWNGAGGLLFEYNNPTPFPLPATAPLLVVNQSATDSLVLSWGNSWGIAVDNIAFEQFRIEESPIPEPATVWSALGALGLIGAARFLRRG